MTKQTTTPTKRPLTIAVIIALLLGAILLAPFFGIIVLSAIAAYIFFPLYAWLQRKLKRDGAASALTVLLTLFVVVLPVIAVGYATFVELQQAARSLSNYAQTTDLNELSETVLERVNGTLASITNGSVSFDIAQAREFVVSNISNVVNAILGFVTSSLGGISSAIIALVLYLYIFTALLVHHKTLVRTFKGLNPLGDRTSDLYLLQTGAMTKAMVRGQFIIAALQGFVGALSLYIAGIDLFWIMILILTVLSIIPLGGGVVTIPIGVILVLTGNVWQGIMVLLVHFVVVTNIDNVLRPMLVPKEARLNSALTILSVFAGLGMFGLLGIVIGPVLMILIVTTVRLYLAQNDSNEQQSLRRA